MAEMPVVTRKNMLLSFIVAIALLFNLGMIFQSRLTADVSGPRVYNRSSTNSAFHKHIHVAFFGKFGYRNMKIVRGIARTFHTMLEHTTSPIYLHVLLDLVSKQRVARTLRGTARGFRRRLNVSRLFLSYVIIIITNLIVIV